MKKEKEKNVNEKIFLNFIIQKETVKIYIIILVLSILTELISLIAPIMLSKSIRLISLLKNNNPINIFDWNPFILIIVYFLLLLLENGIAFWTNYLTLKLRTKLTEILNIFVLNIIATLKLSSFNNVDTLSKRIKEDPETIANAIISGSYLIISIIFKIIIIIYVLKINLILGSIYIVSIFSIFFIDKSFIKIVKELKRKYKKNNELVNNLLTNSLNGISDINNFNFDINHYLSRMLTKHKRVENKRDFYIDFFNMIRKTLLIMITFIVIIVAIYFVIKGSLQVDQLIVLFSFKDKIFNLMKDFSNLRQLKIDFEIAKSRIFELKSDKKFPKTKYGNKSHNFKGNISFKKVSFGYKNNRILKNLDFSVKAGDTVALIGSSGSGKSTILKLINYIDTVNSGEIKFDGVNINKINKTSLRRGINFIPQNPIIFEGFTIRENLLLAKPNATQEELVLACEQACIDNLVKDRFNQIIGKEINLSGGEKQRIAIARAFLKKDSPILLIDEGTSALDLETQKKVMNNLKFLGKTTVIVAHRLETIVDADYICLLERGRIVQSGNHEELIKNSETYRKLYDSEEIY